MSFNSVNVENGELTNLCQIAFNESYKNHAFYLFRDAPEPTGEEVDDSEFDAPKIYERVSGLCVWGESEMVYIIKCLQFSNQLLDLYPLIANIQSWIREFSSVKIVCIILKRNLIL